MAWTLRKPTTTSIKVRHAGTIRRSNDLRDVLKWLPPAMKEPKSPWMFTTRTSRDISVNILFISMADCIIFTAGRENAIDARANICKDMDAMGIIIDEEKNNVEQSGLM